MIGKTISRYRIVEKLGEGGMGVVYKAEDTRLHRSVALKFLSADATGSPDHHARFLKEAEAAAALEHPNITTIYDIGEEDGQTFIAMSLVDGKTLAEKISERPLPLEEAFSIAIQAGEALQVAHERGVVHRDIKPGNIMITLDGRVKVMDFGLAHLAGQTRITKTGTVMGTPAYMSPEQAEGQSPDRRTDIWSLGVVVYEMVTGRLPFRGDTDHAVLRAILDDQPEPMTAIRVGTPPELDRIVAKALRKRADERYHHVDELLVDLRMAVSRQLDAVPMDMPPPASRWLGLQGMIAASILVAATAIVTWNLKETAVVMPAPDLRRLTAGSGLSDWPVVSPNGDLIAYASDRGGDGNMDIWVQQVTGGEPVRVTDDTAIDTEPDFSPDGSRIAFRSQRNPPGVYVVSALGGDARFIAPNGREPRFSPDGEWLAYWVGPLHSDAPNAFVTSLAGGQPREIQPDFFGVGYPIWSPDGESLLFSGLREAPIRQGEPTDWWVTPVVGGEATRTGARAALGDLNPARIIARDWVGNHVVFSAEAGGSENIWRVSISEGDWQVRDAPGRLTAGSGLETRPRLSATGTLTFAGMHQDADIWALPVRANQGQVTGEIRRLIQGAADDWNPRLSGDGSALLYQSNRDGSVQVWLSDLETGKLSQITHREQPLDVVNAALLSRDGSKVAYREAGSDADSLYVTPVRGGSSEKVCDDCGRPVDWWPLSPRYLLLEPSVIAPGRRLTATTVHDLNTGESRFLLRHPTERVHDACWSSDGRWIAFHTTVGGVEGTVGRQMFVARYQADGEIPREEWSPLTDGSAEDRVAMWSPNGNLFYFTSDRDGSRCLWALPLHPETKEPNAEPFAVHHLHSTRFSLPAGSRNLAVADDTLVFALTESRGNIWLMEPEDE